MLQVEPASTMATTSDPTSTTARTTSRDPKLFADEETWNDGSWQSFEQNWAGDDGQWKPDLWGWDAEPQQQEQWQQPQGEQQQQQQQQPQQVFTYSVVTDENGQRTDKHLRGVNKGKSEN